MTPAVSEPEQTKDLSLEYIAGFFDGEGHVSIRRANKYLRRTPTYRCVVGFTNTELIVLRAIQSRFGGGIYSKARYSNKSSPSFELIIFTNEEVLAVLHALEPHVVMKRQQIRLALDFLALGKMKRFVASRGQNHGGTAKTHPIMAPEAGEIEAREKFKVAMGELNARGPKCLQ